MMTTLVMPCHVVAEIERVVRLDVETAGVMLAGHATEPDGSIRILVQDIFWVDNSAYLRRESHALSIASHGYVSTLGEAERRGAFAIWFHTHPGLMADPRPSVHDAQVDLELADLFRLRTGSTSYGTLIASPRPEGLALSGTLQREGESAVQIKRFLLLGSPWRLLMSSDSAVHAVPPHFDRNVRAFGPAIQTILGQLRVGVIGCGGTGSAVAEQLTRLGIRNLRLLDPDELSASNVTRVYGSTPDQVGRNKVDVLRDHLTRIAPDLDCHSIVGTVSEESSARMLIDRDILFGCTDDNAGRLVLSRIATYLLAPVLDLGVVLSSSGEQLSGIFGRVTVLEPGGACLVCRNRIDLARAAAETMTHEERSARVAEGYAPALPGVEPAVVAFTTAVAAAAVNELLERLIGYGMHPRPSEILLRLHDREISTNNALPRKSHYCDPTQGALGRGDSAPFLGQAWPKS